MRVAIGGIAVECCTFSPRPTELEDFVVLRSYDLLERHPYLSNYPDVAWVPLLFARAVPGGSVTPQAYDALKAELIDGLTTNGPWDAVYLDLHGAMHVAGLQDAEGDLLCAVRDAVGADVVLGASFDLHGNLSGRVVSQLDCLTAYRTAPHIDGEQTRERAAGLLLESATSGVRPVLAFVPIPTLLPGEFAMTTLEPGLSLYGRVASLPRARPDVIDASILVGYAWADEPRAGSSVVVAAHTEEAAREESVALANALWEARRAFVPGHPLLPPHECLERARRATSIPVFISDSGDNVTGGGVGDVPRLLELLIASDTPDALFASLYDPAAVDACAHALAAGRVGVTVSPTGARLSTGPDPEPHASITLGSGSDRAHGGLLAVRATVRAVHELASGARHAVVRVGAVDVILTDRRTAFTELRQFRELGLDPTKYRVVAVKLGYLFPELRAIAADTVIAATPGAIPLDVRRLSYGAVSRPIFPLDDEFVWTPRPILSRAGRVYTDDGPDLFCR